ncbi:MAG: hypothetical protein ACM3IG_03125 [Myxococcales bacterium]|jgi:hypothetical protein|nr:hypothetical protein [Sphingomicrobium sp.]
MTTQTIIIIVVVVAIIALLAARGGGPRVTQIDRTVRRKKEGDER